MAKKVYFLKNYINNSNLNYQGLSSNGYFISMCQKIPPKQNQKEG